MAGRTLRAFRSRLIFRAILVIAFFGRRLPLRVARACGRALGRLAWHVARRERKRALKNIALAFPEWSADQRERVIRAIFRHHGMSLFEIVWMPNIDAARFLARDVWPSVRTRFGDARLMIAGKDPVGQVRELGGQASEPVRLNEVKIEK